MVATAQGPYAYTMLSGLLRGKVCCMHAQADGQQTWQLEMRGSGDMHWSVAVAGAQDPLVTVPNLKPGTKYSFRSRISECCQPVDECPQ